MAAFPRPSRFALKVTGLVFLAVVVVSIPFMIWGEDYVRPLMESQANRKVLLTLLALGVKGIRVGPLPPAFITPNVFKVLQEKFDLKLIEAEPPTSLYSLTTVPPAAASMPV